MHYTNSDIPVVSKHTTNKVYAKTTRVVLYVCCRERNIIIMMLYIYKDDGEKRESDNIMNSKVTCTVHQ